MRSISYKFFLVPFLTLAIVFSIVSISKNLSPNDVSAQTGNFIGIQLSEGGGDESAIAGPYGDPQYAMFGNLSNTEYAKDNNAFDPNYARVWIGSIVPPNTDFQIGIQTIDGANHGPGCDEQDTSPVFTPWASDGGGSSGWQSDTNVYDPNCARLLIKTRPMPAGKGVTDFKLGVAVGNGVDCRSGSAQPSTWTPWAASGGGWSGWSFASPNDFDCILVGLQARIVQSGSVIIETKADGTNPPPPSMWALLNSAGGVVAQEANGSIREQYNNLPQGSYTIDTSVLPHTINYGGNSYVLDNSYACPGGGTGPICPGDTALLGQPDNSCSAGTYNPHSACVQGSCQVVSGCGYSNCSACSAPEGDPRPPTRPPQEIPPESRAPWGIPITYAASDPDNVHNVCTEDYYCESISGAGVDECDTPQNPTCPGYVPPSLPPPPPVPAAPSLTFTIHYKVQGGGSFSVDLTPTPASGPSPLLVNLTATPYGGSGTPTYVFWKNCDRPGTDTGSLFNNCGPSEIPPFTYTGNPGQVFTPKVVATRDLNGAPAMAEDRATVTITGGPLTCSGPGPTAFQNTPVVFTGSGGTGAYTWSSDPQGSGSGSTYTVTFPTTGQKTITINSGALRNTCNITILPPNGPSLVCVGPPSAARSQNVTFTATSNELSGDYAWSGGGTPPTGGPEASFTTNWFYTGWKTVTTTRGALADSCRIQILEPEASNCTINVISNAPTNWLIGGPTQNGQFVTSPTYPNLVPGATHTTDSSGNPLIFGTYSIMVPQTANGWSNPTVTPANSGTCSTANPIINFNINYANGPTQLTCSPPEQTASTATGGTASFTATKGTGNYSWSAPGGMPIVGTGPEFSTSYISSGAKTVTLTDGVASTTCSVTVFGDESPRCNGPTSLAVGQNGTFYAAGGTGNYTWTASAQGWGDAVPSYGIGSSFTTHFTAIGGGNKVVRLWSGTGNDVCSVSLTNSTHRECVNQSCRNVGGVGPNRCGSNADCGGGPFYGACDSTQHACVNRSGSGPSCTSDPNCAGITESHLACQNNSCVIVGGAGSNGTCTAVGASCITGPGTCTFTANPQVISRDNASQLEWVCDGGLAGNNGACVVTNILDNAIVTTGNGSGSVPVRPTITTPYSLNCNSGAFTGSVTVRVLSIIEVPPR